MLVPGELTLHGGMKPTSDDLGQVICKLYLSVFLHVSNIYYEPVSLVNYYYYVQDSMRHAHFLSMSKSNNYNKNKSTITYLVSTMYQAFYVCLTELL